MRRVIPDSKSDLRVTDDPNEIITHFLIYTVGSVAEGEMSLDDLLSKFRPDGQGFSIPTLLNVYRVESVEDSLKKNWPLSDPDFRLPNYKEKDYWNIIMNGAYNKGKLEIDGDELRRLIHEAYQIYLEKGSVRKP